MIKQDTLLGSFWLHAAWLLPMTACAGETVVGEAATTASGGETGLGGETASGGATSSVATGGATSSVATGGWSSTLDCDPIYAHQRDIYSEWESEPNDLGDLAGKTFRGYIEGGLEDVVLDIQQDGTATITFNDGKAAPVPEKDKTMSPGEGIFPLEGYVYPLHGATLENGRLQIDIPIATVHEEWCALQDPVPHPAEGECVYGIGPDWVGTVECNDVCTYSSGEVYDRHWMDLVLSGPCYCDPDGCFAHVGDDYDSLTIDARVSDTGDEIEGTFSATTDAPLILTLE